MRLHLINDLPLFAEATEDLDDRVPVLAGALPAAVSYTGYADLLTLWAKLLALGSWQRVLLVGTRPPLLTSRVGKRPADGWITATTRRRLDAEGHTTEVEILADLSAWRTQAADVAVLDDVAMSATTLAAALDHAAGSAAAVGGRFTVHMAFATGHALSRLRLDSRVDDCSAQVELAFRPIAEGTVIFLSDLFFGRLRELPFLDQAAMLAPFFGTQLEPWRRLRTELADRCAERDVPGLIGVRQRKSDTQRHRDEQ